MSDPDEPRRRLISVIAPVYEERENVARLCEELTEVLEALPYDHEILLVDDGSGPETVAALREASQRHPTVNVIRFSRNFGHQAALSAGLDHAQGDAVVMMDADLQHPPSFLPRLVSEWEAGHEVVYAIRAESQQLGLFKRATSSAFYALLNAVSDTPIQPSAPDFRLLDRRAVDALNSLRERTRFLRGLTTWIGFSQLGLEYPQQDRQGGVSKFSLRKMVRLAADGLISMSTLPLKLSIFVGCLISLVGFAYMSYVVWAFFYTNRAIQGWSSLMVVLLFLMGIQFNLLGILGLYLAKVYDEVKGRPLYVIRERFGGGRS